MGRRGRRILGWLVAVPVGLAVGLGLAVWLAGSEAALRFLAGRAEALSGGRLAIHGVAGSLYGPLRIDAMAVRGEETRVELRGLALDWSPRALGRRSLLISEFTLAELHIVELKPAGEASTPPDTLRLPLAVSLPRGRVERLVLKTGQGEWTLGAMRFALHKPDRLYRLDLHGLDTPWGTVRGRASLDESPPFALEGAAEFRHASGLATATATGRLEDIRLVAEAALAGGQGQADLRLAPFARRLLAEARISAAGLDPSRWEPTWPAAALDVSARLHSEGAETFAGQVSLVNRRPGPWDRGRLPLRQLDAAVRGDTGAADLTGLALDLGRAGRFSGQGRLDGQGAALDLKTRDFDPRGLHSKLRSLRLAGDVKLRGGEQRQQVLADLAHRRYRLRLEVEQHARTLHIKEAVLTSGAGSLTLHGNLGLNGSQSFDLTGALSGFDPAAFGDYPAARINASFDAHGRLAPAPEAQLSFAVADSHFRRQPLAGQGHLRLAEGRLWDSDASVRLGDNQLTLAGAFGRPGDRLKWRLQARQPAILHGDLSGRLEADGEVTGSLAVPAGWANVEAADLGWGRDYRLARLTAEARLEQGLSGELILDADLAGLRLPGAGLDVASLRAHGRRDRHTLTLAAGNADLDLAAELTGTLTEQAGRPAWSGQLRRFANRGRFPVGLLAPAGLELGGWGLRLENARVTALDGVFDVAEASYQAGAFASRGTFKDLAAAGLGRWPGWPQEVGGDLVLDGSWRIDAGERVDGRLLLARRQGDLVLSVPGQPATALGLKALQISAEAAGNRLQATLEADGAVLGQLRIRGETRLSRRDGAWGLAGDAPLQASAELALRSLAWAAPIVDPSGATLLDGSLTARVQADGSLAAPRLGGSLAGEGLRLALPEQGLDLRDGDFQAELRQEQGQDILELTRLRLRGGEGSLSGQGRLALRNGQPEMAPELRLALKAERLTVASRPDRLLILSGDGNLGLSGRQLRLDARLKADRGVVELAGDDAPVLSDDVVVLGREQATPAKGLPYAVSLDLDLNLGDRFFLKGWGLDAQLGGAVRIAGRQGAPLRANGSIRVVKGAYSAYGQKLDLERGILNFQGPPDNPGLNIVALRRNQAVEAGVAITGTARAPVVKLVSNPSVPDGEKLSWLVLGRGLADAGGGEFDALQLAAGALLGAGESVTLQQRIAHAAGLEEVSLKGAGSLETAVLTLGKRLSSRAYLSYEQGLAGTAALVKINYTLTERLSLRAQAGTTPALDLFYTFGFD